MKTRCYLTLLVAVSDYFICILVLNTKQLRIEVLLTLGTESENVFDIVCACTSTLCALNLDLILVHGCSLIVLCRSNSVVIISFAQFATLDV